MKLGSKTLGSPDVSGFEFDKEMLSGDTTFAIDLDRVQWDNDKESYVILELLRCHKRQFKKGITPYSSHPNKYFHKNPGVWLSLWRLTKDLKGTLYLVNYSKKGTDYENEVLLMRVSDVDPSKDPPIKTKNIEFTRRQYSKWFRRLNKRGQRIL